MRLPSKELSRGFGDALVVEPAHGVKVITAARGAHERIVEAETAEWRMPGEADEDFRHGAPEPADEAVLLDRDDARRIARGSADGVGIDRLDGRHAQHARGDAGLGEDPRGAERGADDAAGGDEGEIAAF